MDGPAVPVAGHDHAAMRCEAGRSILDVKLGRIVLQGQLLRGRLTGV